MAHGIPTSRRSSASRRAGTSTVTGGVRCWCCGTCGPSTTWFAARPSRAAPSTVSSPRIRLALRRAQTE
eukprot:1601620-Pyramimonas_sp.AAC.1